MLQWCGKMYNLKVDFYTATGKWYSGCVIEDVDDCCRWDTDELRCVIEGKQTAIRTDSISNFYCVASAVDSNVFSYRLFKPGDLVNG